MKHSLNLGRAIRLGLAVVVVLLGSAIARAQQFPIPIPFTLDQPGYVTLVIDDAEGKRVRNLMSETFFPAGQNVVTWDGRDDTGRKKLDPGYEIVATPVKPGEYRVRGLVRPQIDLRHEFAPYEPGNPPWPNNERTGGWLADHSPPSTVLFIPEADAPAREGRPTPGGQILVGSDVVEFGDGGIVWLDLDGRKIHGQKWVGGVWTAAPYVARDTGPNPVPGVYAYSAASFKGGGSDGAMAEIRLAEWTKPDGKTQEPRDARFGVGEDRPLLSPRKPYRGILPDGKDKLDLPDQDMRYAFPDNALEGVSGLAVYNGLLVVSLPRMNQLLWVDAVKRRIIGLSDLPDPHGLAFDAKGRLLALSGKRLVRITPPGREARYPSATPSSGVPAYGRVPLAAPVAVIESALEDPHGITVGSDGLIYVSDRGQSHQVRVFDEKGALQKEFGKRGVPATGPYDPLRMNNPDGVTLDSRNRLWVAEHDHYPKRISVWNPDGTLDRAFYGPHAYGGGGTLDPADRTRYLYEGMEFKLDWEKGESTLVNVLNRYDGEDREIYDKDNPRVPEGPDGNVFRLPVFGHQQPPSPERPFVVNGRRYYTSAYSTQPTNGTPYVALWLERDGRIVPVAATGRVNRWPLLHRPEFASLIPEGVDFEKDQVTAFWQDTNADGRVQPEETVVRKEDTGPILVLPDLSFITGRSVIYRPKGFDAEGRPSYDFSQGETAVPGARLPNTSGGGQVYPAAEGWTILTVPPEPYPQAASVAGARNGVPVWTYPHLWPGLHISNKGPLPKEPGEMIGGTRLLGPPVRPREGDAGEIWAMHGNKGNVYLLTTDGLFVATLWKDSRKATWNESKAERGMLTNDLSLRQEAFYSTITQAEDTGEIYIQGGFHGGLNRVEGLEKIRRLPETTITITPELFAAATAATGKPSEPRKEKPQKSMLAVPTRGGPTIVDGRLDDWSRAKWVQIDDKVRAALAVSGDRLYVVFDTKEAGLLANRPEALETLFKSGGALDLMIGANPTAEEDRSKPVAGDSRLLVTLVNGKPAAALFQPVAPSGVAKKPYTYTSPVTTLTFDRVEDVSTRVNFMAGRDGVFEYSVPLSILGIDLTKGRQIRGDIGVLRGDGANTMERVYWSNKETGLTSDVPSEAQLTPGKWGTVKFE